MKSNIQKNIELLKKLPKSEYYRFIVDGVLQSKEDEVGWLGYAMREENSLPNALAALRSSLLEGFDNKTLSIDLICKIHKIAMQDTKNTFASTTTAGKFRETDYPGGYTLKLDDNCSLAGLHELNQFVEENVKYGTCIGIVKKREYFLKKDEYEEARVEVNNLQSIGSIDSVIEFLQKQKPEDSYELMYRAPKSCYIEEILQKICKDYNQNILQAKKDDAQRLKIIITGMRKLEWLHPFRDGNCRVVDSLLKRVSLQNAFLPPMLYDPNRFDSFSLEELSDDVQQGSKNTADICENNEHVIFSCDTKKIENHIQEVIHSDDDNKWHIAPEMRATFFSSLVKKQYKLVEHEITKLYEAIQNFKYLNPNENQVLAKDSPVLSDQFNQGQQPENDNSHVFIT